MKKIAVYCEINSTNNLEEVSYQLISKMFELKNSFTSEEFEIDAIAQGASLEENSVEKAYKAGANRVILIKNGSKDFVSTLYSECFMEFYYKNTKYDYIIFPATLTCRSLAPRITTILNTGLVADCTRIEFIEKNGEIKLAATRPTFGSELMATILSKTSPECATIRPNTFKTKFNNDKKGEYVEFNCLEYDEFRIKIIQEILEKNNENNPLLSAKIVFCAGFGLNGDGGEYFKKLEKLAKIYGAEYATTRKVVDFNLAKKETQIGQTGLTIQSKLYVGFGVSGAIQHIQGMKNCEKIIAINIDENADIFNYSDYKIITDAKKIIDDLLEKAQK